MKRADLEIQYTKLLNENDRLVNTNYELECQNEEILEVNKIQAETNLALKHILTTALYLAGFPTIDISDLEYTEVIENYSFEVEEVDGRLKVNLIRIEKNQSDESVEQ